MTVITYQNGCIYSDDKMLSDNAVSGSKLTFRHAKAYKSGDYDIAFAFSGRIPSQGAYIVIRTLLLLAIAAQRLRVSGLDLEISGASALDKLIQEQRELIKLSADELPSFIGGVAGFVFYYSEMEQKIKPISPSETFCIGSDAISVYMLIKAGYSIKQAYEMAASCSNYISTNLSETKLGNYSAKLAADIEKLIVQKEGSKK